MSQYIDKSTLTAWIKEKKIPFKKDIDDGVYPTYLCALMDFEDFLDTLEGKGVIAGQECICNGVFNKIIGSSWNLTIPLDKVGLKHGDKVEVLIIKR